MSGLFLDTKLKIQTKLIAKMTAIRTVEGFVLPTKKHLLLPRHLIRNIVILQHYIK